MHSDKDSEISSLLVTGGAGFIGSAFVRMYMRGSLISSKIEKMTILDSLTYAGDLRRIPNLESDKRIKFIKGDIRNSELVSELVSTHDGVIHFAAESHVDKSITNPREFIDTNIVGTYNLLEASRIQNKRILVVSTDEVYGSLDEGFASEDWPLNPSSAYSASKASADLLAMSYFKTYKLNVVISRCVNNFGKYQDEEKLIPKFIDNLKNGIKVPVYGNGMNVREWIHVEDHCSALDLILQKGIAGNIYNIPGTGHYSSLEIARMLIAYSNLDDSYIEFVGDRLGHDVRYALDGSKMEELLDWKPSKLLVESLDEISESWKL